MECFKCGISDEKAVLYDVITGEGIVKMCEKCSRYEDSPVIRKPTVFQLKEVERKPGVYERLSKMVGFNPDERKKEKSPLLINQETNLRLLVDKNYIEKAQKPVKRADLIDNFHWVIMRTRRAKKITQRQLAEAIGEAEAAIKRAEEGILPENNYLLNKIQSYLGINLLKEKNNPASPFMQNRSGDLQPTNFDRKNPNQLTISDLKRMIIKEDEREEIEEVEKSEEIAKGDKEDLSDDEMHDLIFRKS